MPTTSSTSAAALRWLATPDDIWDAVLGTQRALVDSSRHRTVKIPDLIVAAVAGRHGATVLHYDADYDAIADIPDSRCSGLIAEGLAALTTPKFVASRGGARLTLCRTPDLGGRS
jgi:hypothetical protein